MSRSAASVPGMRSTYSDRVAAEVRAELGRQHKTQRELAEALGVSQVFVSRRLRGEVAFSLEELERIAEALDVPIIRLMALQPT